MEWDTAAADIIVSEAGGVVVQAGKVTGRGELLEDWKVSGQCVGAGQFIQTVSGVLGVNLAADCCLLVDAQRADNFRGGDRFHEICMHHEAYGILYMLMLNLALLAMSTLPICFVCIC
jgi:hypothetical protein